MSRPCLEIKTFSPITGNNYFLWMTDFYSVIVLVAGQQTVLAVTVASDFGQQLGTSSPAQHGLIQSGGQVFGQQSGLPSSAQHGLVGSSGQVFATDLHSAF
jgi:hypothetical protein